MTRSAVMVALGAALAAAGCGGDGSSDGARATLTVSAAASLTEALEVVEADFEAAHPDIDVVVNLDSSAVLASQILEGAPADVFASADERTMARVDAAGLLDGVPVVVAANDLVVVTGPGNPEGIGGLADLAAADVVALCAPEAPCGRLAEEALDAAGVAIPDERVTHGQNVKATLAAVRDGDAAAGIVYRTDAASAGSDVAVVEIDAPGLARYPVAALADASDPDAAEAFVAHLAGPEGQAALADAGFLAPPRPS